MLWLTPDATEMTEQDWSFPNGRFLSYVLSADESGRPPVFLVLNAAPEAIEFTLPAVPGMQALDERTRYLVPFAILGADA